MGKSEIMLYVIIIIVVLMKIMFWTLYFCLRNRRQKQLRSQQQAASNARGNHLGVTRYEEQAAVPQPAYVFTGYPGNPVQTALTSSLPDYQDEDPYKVDCPPPSYYNNEYHAEEELPEVVVQTTSVVVVSDRQELIPDEDSS